MMVEPMIPEQEPLEVRRARSMKALADLRDILDIVLRAGKLLLENGGETWRVEDTVHRLGIGLGAEGMEVYPTPTGIIVSSMLAGEHRAHIIRVPHLGVDLSRVGAVLDLVRRSDQGALSRAAARAELVHISQMPRAYSAPLTVLAMALAGACYGALQGGGLAEFGLGLLAAAATVLVRNGLNAFFGRPVLLSIALSAFFGAAVALLAVQVVACQRPELVVIASVIALLPGVVMINSIADLINANYVSGLARAAQAAIVLGAVATGAIVAVAAFGGPVHL